jgi:hypothetical protein
MMVGSFGARVEGCGGHKEMEMGWSYKVKWSSRVHAGSGPASLCRRALYKKTTEDENKKKQERTTY